MKLLVVFSCLLVVAYGLSPEIKEIIKRKAMAAAGECKAEVGASDDDIAAVKVRQAPATQTAKCYVACLHKKFGFLDKSGKIDKDSTYAMIGQMKPIDEELYGKLKQVADACLAKVVDADDECETAANMYDCICKEKDKAGLEPMDM